MSVNFDEVRKNFLEADVEEKIRIYSTTPDLTVDQYKLLLKLFPVKHIKRLEKALG